MNSMRNRLAWITTGFLWAFVSGMPAMADDTELFVGSGASVGGVSPNVLFVLDTSGSMDDQITTQPTYDPATAYPGACTASRVYWRSGTGDPPDCTTTQFVESASFVCSAARSAFDAGTTYTGVAAQWDSVQSSSIDIALRWETLGQGRAGDFVECAQDSGIHGNGINGTNHYATDVDGSLWTSEVDDEISWTSNPTNGIYTFYTGNYLNWYYGSTVTQRKIDILKSVTTDILNGISGVNVGIMRFNDNQGGTVIHEIADVETNRSSLISIVDGLPASDWTPLSETLYEAGLYFRGAAIDYGDAQGPAYTADGARAGAPGTPGYDMYRSPITDSCQRNYVVMITDGEPTLDVDADTKITAQPGYGTVVGGGACSSGANDGECLDEAAEYLYGADLIGDATLPDQQNVVTYTVGFYHDSAVLEETATLGGGEYFAANDMATLSGALSNIVMNILDTSATFSSPTVSVNSFNRTRNLNDLFVALFEPGNNLHWPGNLKRYRVDPDTDEIVDANGNSAVDAQTGFFSETAQSFWSDSVDGSRVSAGGAAHELPNPAARDVYTYLGANAALTAASNVIDTSNPLLDDAVFGIGNPGDPSAAQVIQFARGADTADFDGDGNTTEARNQMGDPLHGKPTTVVYGGTPAVPDIDDAAVFIGTNDGYLHAIDFETGEELWSFIPEEFLPTLPALFQNGVTANKNYGIDGTPVIQKVDVNRNGIIETGDRVYLYFGMRRGGAFYYALDVTNKEAPEFLWKLSGNSLPGLGQTWSTPLPTKMLIDGENQNSEHLVLVIGGGYDPDQDGGTTVTDNVGNAIYVVDSVTGDLLWHASDAGSDRNLAAMQYSIPGDIKVIDLDSDRYADRMYATDMGGQLWRFDVLNNRPVAEFVNGGVIAQLGAAPSGTPSAADSRRFYYAADSSIVLGRGQAFINIAVGSGHRAHPNSTLTQDALFSVRDYAAFLPRSQTVYDLLTPATVADLVDITDDVTTVVPDGSPGWKLWLRASGSFSGEKSLAEARTFNNRLYFTTFEPGTSSLATDCAPRLGINRLYVVDILTGAPVNNLDGEGSDDNLTVSDRFQEFAGSISSEVVFLFPSTDDSTDPLAQCQGDECDPILCVGLQCFPPGFLNNPVRTFWSQENTY
ncbi:MAG TPA: PilC/PilY family type IV pilus protein [Gammaproteobacteria bacterium]|nr:PilC/PilY family type IV pilus protein [Gammaproteobacteria bacterium]